MVNLCLYVLVGYAVGESASAIIFGKKKKSEIYAKKRRMKMYQARNSLRGLNAAAPR